MDTTITIKTKKNIIKEAKALASEMGLNITNVINAFLRQFIRNRELTLIADETISKEKMEYLERLSKEADEDKDGSRVFHDVDSLVEHLMSIK